MIGRTISHYEILEKLGEGGMGAVYKARDTELQRTVAIKALPAEISASETARERFLREARSASALNHAHIITIHDLIRDGDDRYIVMEWVDGQSLEARIPPGGLPVDEAVAIAADVAEALGAAHTAGIVHRDLKPGNVMLTAAGRAKVLDFGIAKFDAAEEDAPTEQALTEAGSILGTIHYMSPEQVRGEPVDRRTDVFSLGVILYEMLTGRRPFGGGNPATLVHAIAYEDPRDPIEIRAGLPEAAVAVLRRALAKDRDGRYQSMATFAADLRALGDALQAGRDPSAGALPSSRAGAAATAGEPAPDPRRGVSGRVPVAAAGLRLFGALALVVVAMVLVAAWLYSRAAGVGEPGPGAMPSTPFAAYEQGQQLLQRFDRQGYIAQAIEAFQRSIALDEDYASGYAGLARAYLYRYYDDSDPLWRRQAESTARQALAMNPHLAAARVTLAESLAIDGQLDGAQQELDAVLSTDPDNAYAYDVLGVIAEARDDLEAAAAAFERRVQLDPTHWEAQDALGSFRFRRGDYEGAREAFVQAVQLAPDSHIARRDLAGAHQALGDLPAAAAELQRALEIRPEASVLSNLGTLYYFQGMYSRAVSAFEDALELEPNDYLLWANLGDAHRMVPDGQQAASDAYRRAIQLLDRELAQQPGDATLRSRRALFLARGGNADAALAEVASVAADTDDPVALYRLVMSAELAGDRSRALALLERAFDGGLPVQAVEAEPELTSMRSDPDYHRLAARYEE